MITGTPFKDKLKGTDLDDLIDALGGDDKISAKDGDDTVFGGDGNDKIDGGKGSDTLFGGDDDDKIKGGKGADTLDGGLGDDKLDGGKGNDTVSFASATAPSGSSDGLDLGATVDLSNTKAQDTGYGMDTIRNIENAIGTDYSDNLTGNDEANALYGGGGRDQLNGAEGDDELFGGAGSDTLEGGEGADSLFGGDGVADLASYASVDHDMTFDLRTDFSDGSNITSAEVKEDIIASDVEGFQGSVNFNNTFYLGGPTTFVRGGELTDTFFGGTGTDQILGLGGDDQISGGDALDAIIGGDGNDDLWGGAFGGTGDGTADIFIFDDADGDDVIHDFEAGMDGLFFVGPAIESLADITIAATSAGGDAGIDDTLITYEAEGQVSTITILDTDSGSVASGLILF